MGLNNSQYNQIMREYERLQAKQRRDLKARMQEIYTKLPKYKELEDNAAKLAIEKYNSIMDGSEADTKKLEEELRELENKKRKLIIEAGYPDDFDKMRYTCPDCKDTGKDSKGGKCHCFRKKEIKLLYAQSKIEDILKKENFDNLSYDYYDSTRLLPKLGISQAEYMKSIISKCKDFVEKFKGSGENLLFMGAAGVGKTYLSNCIAKELIDRYYSVIYLTSNELFDVVGKVKTDKEAPEDMKELYNYILECDLLIIDDLGTELNNLLVSSQLFFIINHRITVKKSTIISTNLSMSMLRDSYTERVSSRLASNYMPITIYGDDIRQKI